MTDFIQLVMITGAVYFAYSVGIMLERIRMLHVLDKTLDRIDEIHEKPAQYRLGYLAALDIASQEVHGK